MDVARGPIEYPGPAHPTDDWVAITEYELREVAEHMPGGRAVPVQVRGFDADQVLVLQANGSGGLPALVALARLRTAITGPTPQEPQSDAQEATQPQDGATPDARLSRLADDMQERVESFLSNLGVDPEKYDHQNHAGDLVRALFGVLRRHAMLLGAEAEEVLNGPARNPAPVPLRRPLNTEECAELRHAVHRAAPAGLSPKQITEITGTVLATLRRMADWS